MSNDDLAKEMAKFIGQVRNPVTDKPISAEQRLKQVSLNNDTVYIKYARDGLTAADQEKLEHTIKKLIAIQYRNYQLTFSTVAENTGAGMVASAQQNPAQLKVGHGAVGADKKSIPGVKKVVAVGSGKGGVGKSTFSVNLAKSLMNGGLRVGVIDADIYGPSLPMLLGLRGQRPVADEESKKIVPLEAYGLKAMSFGLFVGEAEPVIWRGPMLWGVLNQFLFDVDWGQLDILIIDLPPGTGDIQLSMIQNVVVDGAVVISTPQDVALLDGIKGLEMFRKMGIPVIGMVENMSSFLCDNCGKKHFIFGEQGVAKRTEALKVDYLGGIPLDIGLRTGADEGLPYMSNPEYRRSAVWKAYEEISVKISDNLKIS